MPDSALPVSDKGIADHGAMFSLGVLFMKQTYAAARGQ
jgi:hypothetical protein